MSDKGHYPIDGVEPMTTIRRERDEWRDGYQKYADLYEATHTALAELLDADDPDFCQGEVYIAEDEQAECGACAWCRARVALGRPEANAVGVAIHEQAGWEFEVHRDRIAVNAGFGWKPGNRPRVLFAFGIATLSYGRTA